MLDFAHMNYLKWIWRVAVAFLELVVGIIILTSFDAASSEGKIMAMLVVIYVMIRKTGLSLTYDAITRGAALGKMQAAILQKLYEGDEDEQSEIREGVRVLQEQVEEKRLTLAIHDFAQLLLALAALIRLL